MLYLNKANKLFGIDLHTLSIFYTEPYMEYSQNNFFCILCGEGHREINKLVK